MSELQEILIDYCNHAVQRFKINDFHSSYLTMAIVMICLAPVTVILNTVTVYVFWKGKRMKTITDILLCLLTITDIVGGFVAMPSFAAESILRAINIETPCSVFLIRTLIGMSSVDITLVTSILIVLDRYCSIFKPYYYDIRKHQTRAAILVVVLLWCICIAVCLLSIITSKYLLAIAFIAVANTSYVVLGIWVHLKILIQAKRTQREIATKSIRCKTNNRKIKSWHRIKGARMTAVIFCGIFFCYAPMIITGSLMERFDNSRSSRIAFYWTTALVLLNSIVNPLLYIWQMKWFRNALRNVTSTNRKVSVTESTSEIEWR